MKDQHLARKQEGSRRTGRNARRQKGKTVGLEVREGQDRGGRHRHEDSISSMENCHAPSVPAPATIAGCQLDLRFSELLAAQKCSDYLTDPANFS